MKWRYKMDQSVLDKAVKIATKQAMHGRPVRKITWIPPLTAANDPGGIFVIEECGPISATERAPWE